MTEDTNHLDESMVREAERALEDGDYASVLLVYHEILWPGADTKLKQSTAVERIEHAAYQAAGELRRQDPAFPPEVGLHLPFKVAMQAAQREDGSRDLTEAVVGLAHVLEDMPSVRAAAAAFVITHLMEPFGTATRKLHEEKFGYTLKEYLAAIMPDRERLQE